MLVLLSELHFWSTQDDIVTKETDYGSFKYNNKRDNSEILTLSKKTFCQQRGLLWTPNNKRPYKLKERLKEFEELIYHNKVVCCAWEDLKLRLLLSKGILVVIDTHEKTNDIKNITFDKQFCTKLQNEIICDGMIIGSQVLCICTDGRVLGQGGIWREGWSLDAGFRKNCNFQGELLVVWGRSSAEHPQPWCPLAKEHQRANLHLYWIGSRGPDLLSYKKTDGEPISVTVSKKFTKTLIVVEQKVSQRGAVSIEVSSLELVSNVLKRATVTAVPLQTQVSCSSLNEAETRLLLGCIDGSVALLDRKRGSTRIVKASFIPTLAVWNTLGAVAAISNDKGQIQYFDTALNPIKCQINGEEVISLTQLDLSSYFVNQPAIDFIDWKSNNLLIFVEHGPLVLITHMNKSLNFLSVLQNYLFNGQIEKAISFLSSWDWNDQCYIGLQKIVTCLLKKPLSEENIQLTKNALGCYYSPVIPLSLESRHKYGTQVKALTRRFFHQLVRCNMFETAFLLAVDLGHHDLFMDLYYVAVDIGETEMAAAARAQASSLLSRCSSNASSCSRSSCSQCLESCSSEEDISSPDNQESHTLSYSSNQETCDNYLTTNFNSIDPKTFKPSITYSTYIPPIPSIDLPKINFSKPVLSKPNMYPSTIPIPPLPAPPPLPVAPLNSSSRINQSSKYSYFHNTNLPINKNISSHTKFSNHSQLSFKQYISNVSTSNETRNSNLRPILPPPLPIPFSTTNTNLISTPSQLGCNSNEELLNTSQMIQSTSQMAYNPNQMTHNISQVTSNSSQMTHNTRPMVHNMIQMTPNISQMTQNTNQTSQIPHITNQIVHNTQTFKKPQAKEVKFSDTVTAFIVPEVKRPVRPPPPAHVTDPQKELADSLPLCHPNEDYLKDFTPVRRSEQNEPSSQPKIKVVHFGVV